MRVFSHYSFFLPVTLFLSLLFVFPNFSDAAIVYRGATSVGYDCTTANNCNTTGNIVTLTGPTITGSDTVLVIGVSINALNENAPQSVTYDGVTLTPISTGRIDFTRVVSYVVRNPGSAKNVVVDLTDTNIGAVIAAYYTGVDQTTTYRTPTTATGGSSPASLSVTNSRWGDLIAGFFGINDTTAANGFARATMGGGQTFRLQRVNATSESQLSLSDEQGVAGTVTHSWRYTDCGAGCGWAGVAIPLIPARTVLVKPANNLGLVGYWSMNEGVGTSVTDFSGNGNNGTTTATWTSGKFGKGLSFDGVDNIVATKDIDALDGASEMSISVWIKSSPLQPFACWVCKLGPANGWHFGTLNDGVGSAVSFATDFNNTNGAFVSAGVHLANVWEHWVVAYDGTQATPANRITIYKDGVLQSETTTNVPDSTLTSNTMRLTFGQADDLGLFGYSGLMDEVRIYNRTLSQSEVTRLYQSGAAKIGASSAELDVGSSLSNGLVGHWTFDGVDFSDKVYDRSGNGYDGYLFGIATSAAKAMGKLGQALTLSGATGQRVNTPLNTAFTDFSACAWFYPRPNPNGADYDRIIDKSFNTGFWLGRNPGTQDWGGGVVEDLPPYGVFVTLPDYAWHHICIMREGNVRTVIGDGTLTSSSVANSTQMDTTNVSIGERPDTLVSECNCIIDDVRIYNRALSAAEVLRLYRLGQAIVK